MIEVVLNDRLGKKVRVKCNEDDTIGDLKKLVAAQTGTRADKIRIQKWYNIYKDHITLKDYEIHDGMGLELSVADSKMVVLLFMKVFRWLNVYGSHDCDETNLELELLFHPV
ncbi:hypothetical protein M5K25_001474 [Dendrobium thyrsiflorum]|uniref:Ubiquitin-like domain-containing protein n=1 Tax=Dendrobium thyrsiflorum TaxID=117978 RepID=A0ABD0VY32_DENTH